MSNLVNDLKARVGDLQRQLHAAEDRLRAALIEETGIAVGDVVVCRGKEFRVERVEPRSWGGKPWIVGNPKRKDGSWGTAQRNLFDSWTKSVLPASH